MMTKFNYDIDYKVLDKKMVYQGKRISVEESIIISFGT